MCSSARCRRCEEEPSSASKDVLLKWWKWRWNRSRAVGAGEPAEDDEDVGDKVWLWILRIDRVSVHGKTARAALNKLRLIGVLDPLGIRVREDRAPRSRNVRLLEQYAHG